MWRGVHYCLRGCLLEPSFSSHPRAVLSGDVGPERLSDRDGDFRRHGTSPRQVFRHERGLCLERVWVYRYDTGSLVLVEAIPSSLHIIQSQINPPTRQPKKNWTTTMQRIQSNSILTLLA